ncbi:MAG: cell division protein FtsA [Patescibacteria group bacterium]
MARDPYLVSIDIGSHSIKVCVVKELLNERDKLQVLALVDRPSAGIRRGVVTNLAEATEALIGAINDTEAIIGLPIRRAVVGLGGISVSFTNSHGLVVVSRADNEITDGDLDRVIQDSLTRAFGLSGNEIIHVIPKNFSIDNQKGIRYPVGMTGSKLEVETLVISVENSYLRNFTKVVNQSNIDVVSQVYTPLATSDFILSQKQKKAGTVVIDIGFSSTAFIVWENEEILASGVVPVGSDHITADLAVGLQTTIEQAEIIKTKYLDLNSNSDVQTIDVEDPDLHTTSTFSLAEVEEIAKVRAEEIFYLVNKELRKINRQGKLPGGAILVGGGSSLPGVQEVAKETLRLSVFKYNFESGNVVFISDYDSDPKFVNAISLAAYATYHAEDIDYTQSINKPLSRISGGGIGGSRGGDSGGTFWDTIRKVLPWT